MKSRSRFKTLRDYVDAQPRSKSLSDIAAELGIAPNTLSQYLGGHRVPHKDIARRLASKCGIPLENLLFPHVKAS